MPLKSEELVSQRLATIITRVNDSLLVDLEHAFPQVVKGSIQREHPRKRAAQSRYNEGAETDGEGSRRQFVTDLISVVTHAIGLGASISPFNASTESMLAYLMDIFGLTETQLKKILVKQYLEDYKGPKSPTTLKEVRSWRPELRLRLCPPVSHKTKDTSNLLDRLLVRVHFLKQGPISISPLKGQKSGEIIGSFFDYVKRIGPVNSSDYIPKSEFRYEFEFVKQTDNEDTATQYRAVITRGPGGAKFPIPSRSKNQLDCAKLKIRRYHCSRKSQYTVRLEFWARKAPTRLDLLKRMTSRFFGFCQRHGPLDQPKESISINGFADIMLDHLPAYPARTSHPVVSIDDLQISSCEIITDLRNRNLVDDGALDDRIVDCVISHLRLYAICVVHQFSLIQEESKINEFAEGFNSSTSLDNILYLPAHAIINQHRLQSNITLSEDQSLRRSALMLLLTQLDKLSTSCMGGSSLSTHELCIITMIRDEYSNAHRLFDGKTMQEVDLFHHDTSGSNPRSMLIDRIECEAIKQVVERCLSLDRISKWASGASSSETTDLRRLVTLVCLQLIRTICGYSAEIQVIHSELSRQSSSLADLINERLSGAITDALAASLIKALKGGLPRLQAEDAASEYAENQPLSLSLKLLTDIYVIENDLILYWNDKGLNGLQIDILGAIENSKKFSAEDASCVKEVIQSKINKYLSNKF